MKGKEHRKKALQIDGYRRKKVLQICQTYKKVSCTEMTDK
jgi:hypothetical protein